MILSLGWTPASGVIPLSPLEQSREGLVEPRVLSLLGGHWGRLRRGGLGGFGLMGMVCTAGTAPLRGDCHRPEPGSATDLLGGPGHVTYPR